MSCCDHDHPRLARPITAALFGEEIDEAFSGIHRAVRRHGGRIKKPVVFFTDELDATHRKEPRRYAQVDPYALDFEFTRAILWLPARYRRGLIYHEVGHVLEPEGGEDDADRAGGELYGVRIRYDRRWPGKGLQYI